MARAKVKGGSRRAKSDEMRTPLDTFREFPPREKPGTFTIDEALEKMQSAAPGSA